MTQDKLLALAIIFVDCCYRFESCYRKNRNFPRSLRTDRI